MPYLRYYIDINTNKGVGSLTTAISLTSSSRCCSKTVGDDVRLSKVIFYDFRGEKGVIDSKRELIVGLDIQFNRLRA